MRLIRTAHPIELGEYWDNEVANFKYAILSHRWEGEEITFQEMMAQTVQTRRKKGYQKIARFCERARADGFEYVWVDTCCLNKESSAELTESINSYVPVVSPVCEVLCLHERRSQSEPGPVSQQCVVH